MSDTNQLIDLSQKQPEKRVRLDPARLGPGGSGLARYLELWRDARNGDTMALLSRIQARGLDRRVLSRIFRTFDQAAAPDCGTCG